MLLHGGGLPRQIEFVAAGRPRERRSGAGRKSGPSLDERRQIRQHSTCGTRLKNEIPAGAGRLALARFCKSLIFQGLIIWPRWDLNPYALAGRGF